MACPSKKNVLKRNKEHRQKYQQLAFEIRERRPGYRVEVIPIVIGCMGGGGVMREQVRKILINSDTDKVCRDMKNGGYGIGEHTEQRHHQHQQGLVLVIK